MPPPLTPSLLLTITSVRVVVPALLIAPPLPKLLPRSISTNVAVKFAPALTATTPPFSVPLSANNRDISEMVSDAPLCTWKMRVLLLPEMLTSPVPSLTNTTSPLISRSPVTLSSSPAPGTCSK